VIPDYWLYLNAKFNISFCSKFSPLSKRIEGVFGNLADAKRYSLRNQPPSHD